MAGKKLHTTEGAKMDEPKVWVTKLTAVSDYDHITQKKVPGCLVKTFGLNSDSKITKRLLVK